MADRMLVAFGKYLRLLRDRRKLSLSDVVTLTKSYPEPVGKGYLSRVERGLARVGFSKMVALSRALLTISLDAFGEKAFARPRGRRTEECAEYEWKDVRGTDIRGRAVQSARADVGTATQRFATRCRERPSIPCSWDYRDSTEQVTRATLSHGSCGALRQDDYALALAEFGL